MESRWSDNTSERMVQQYAASGIGRDLALRVYTSRLLGQDRRLVLHGGGNTSVKLWNTDMLGEEVQVLLHRAVAAQRHAAGPAVLGRFPPP